MPAAKGKRPPKQKKQEAPRRPIVAWDFHAADCNGHGGSPHIDPPKEIPADVLDHERPISLVVWLSNETEGEFVSFAEWARLMFREDRAADPRLKQYGLDSLPPTKRKPGRPRKATKRAAVRKPESDSKGNLEPIQPPRTIPPKVSRPVNPASSPNVMPKTGTRYWA